MSSSSSFCLACGCPAEAGNRRVLSCDTSGPVRAAWEEVLDCKLAEKGLNKSVLLGGEGFPAVSRGYVCRKCYNLLNGYCERRKVLFHNIDHAIEVLQQCTDPTISNRARKRASDAGLSGPAAKSPRLAVDREQVFFLYIDATLSIVRLSVHACSALFSHSRLLLRPTEWGERGAVQAVLRGQQQSH